MGHNVSSFPTAYPRLVDVRLKNGKSAVIRDAEPADFPRLGEVYAATYVRKEGVKEHWTAQDATKMLLTIDSFPNGVGVVAEIDGKIVGGSFGFCLSWESGSRSFKELETFVLPEMQQNGVGTHLREIRRQRAEKCYHPTFYELITFSNIDQPKRWYERLGFATEDDLVIMTADAEKLNRNLPHEAARITLAGKKALA